MSYKSRYLMRLLGDARERREGAFGIASHTAPFGPSLVGHRWLLLALFTCIQPATIVDRHPSKLTAPSDFMWIAQPAPPLLGFLRAPRTTQS